MIRPEYRKTLESQHGVLVVLWVIFVVGIILYLWISEFLLAGRKLSAGPAFSEPARIVLWLLAFFDLGALAWWKKRFLTKGAILVAGLKKTKLLQALQGHESPLEEQAAGAISFYVTAKIVAFAMVEAIAIYGFALALIGHDLWGQYPLSLASGVLLLLEFPSRPFLEELLRDVEEERQK